MAATAVEPITLHAVMDATDAEQTQSLSKVSHEEPAHRDSYLEGDNHLEVTHQMEHHAAAEDEESEILSEGEDAHDEPNHISTTSTEHELHEGITHHVAVHPTSSPASRPQLESIPVEEEDEEAELEEQEEKDRVQKNHLDNGMEHEEEEQPISRPESVEILDHAQVTGSPKVMQATHMTAEAEHDTPAIAELDARPSHLAIDTTVQAEPQTPLSTSPELLTPTLAVSPLTPAEVHDLSRDSMTSIALSDTSMDYQNIASADINDMLATPKVSGARHRRKPSSLDIMQNKWDGPDRQSTLFDLAHDVKVEKAMSAVEAERDMWARDSVDFGTPRSMSLTRSDTLNSEDLLRPHLDGSETPRRVSSSTSSDEENQVDWQKLDETEEQEKEDKELPEGAEDESTAFLLARLEQENAKFSVDPKSMAGKVISRSRKASRPPSMAQLKKLVSGQDTPTIRYSLAPTVQLPEEPPPMTELEFWAALVQDYPSTAVRLPTLTTTKIRAGIPPPLRGVVWTSMAGARDKHLEDAFERLVHEKSPYEGIINKDVGRSFPGVELFRDADGEGQRMLGRVLKCFSLQDKDIGYCQGLGFLVGPLLMNMGEREAFCVLVRLMDHYSLRPSFLPSLAGLHMRIFQFSSLLKQHNPKLFDHLAQLGVEPAYLSQWFLSCFAVTCPLTMLFRIYDVIFAEGANETVMRVALALVRRHETRIMESTEFEDIMQLLLGREIWDCYAGDADEMVDDFTSLGDIVTHGRLSELDREFNTQSSETIGQSAGFLPDVQAAASRFLGRLWAPGHASTPSRTVMHAAKQSLSTLSPYSADRDGIAGAVSFFTRPGTYLKRSPSKQSINMQENSNSEDSTSTTGSGSTSLASTAPTELDTSMIMRGSVADSMSTKSIVPTTPGFHKEQLELHGQIEDLLTALSEMQREHAQLSAMLQREREERSEDHRAMKLIVGRLDKSVKDDRRQTLPAPAMQKLQAEARINGRPLSVGGRREIAPAEEKQKDEMEELIEKIHARLDSNLRFSASLETRAQLRSTLARTREQLAFSENQAKELGARLGATEAALDTFQSESDDLRAEVKELRARVADEFRSRQKMEHQLGEMQAQARSVERKERAARIRNTVELQGLVRSDGSQLPRARQSSVSSMPPGNVASNGGLREFKLGRRDSTSSIQTLRSVRHRSQVRVTTPEPESTSPQEDSQVASSVDESAASDAATEASRPATPAPSVPEAASVAGSSFAPRTTSLAVQEVLATPEHEPIPEDALLLELVNSKTSEAQARQEIDELKRALNINRRRQDEAIQQLRAEMEAAKAEAAKTVEAAKAETAKALEAAQAARADADAAKARDASQVVVSPLFSLPPTPFGEDGPSGQAGSTSAASTPQDEKAGFVTAKKAETAPASSGGGWFWGRRTASRGDIPVPQ